MRYSRNLASRVFQSWKAGDKRRFALLSSLPCFFQLDVAEKITWLSLLVEEMRECASQKMWYLYVAPEDICSLIVVHSFDDLWRTLFRSEVRDNLIDADLLPPLFPKGWAYQRATDKVVHTKCSKVKRHPAIIARSYLQVYHHSVTTTTIF